MAERQRVLLIEDNPGDVRLIREMLSEAEEGLFELECVGRLSQGLEYLSSRSAGVVLLDLSLRKGTTLTKEMFLNHLYGGMDEPELKIIDVFICKLRKKLANASDGKNFIETVWGRGYVLREPSDDDMRVPAE